MRATREYICYERDAYQGEIERLMEEGFRIVSQDRRRVILEDERTRIIVRYARGVA